MNKKAIAILGAIFILIVGTLGFLIFSKSSGNKTTPSTDKLSTSTPVAVTSTTPTPTPTPTAPQGAVKLGAGQVFFPVLFYSGSGITYFDPQGALNQASFDSSSGSLQLANQKKLSVPTKAGIVKVLWPQKTDNFIAQLSQNGQNAWSIYDSTTGAYVDMPPQVQSIDWLPSGTQVIIVWLDKGQATLYSSDANGKTYTYIGKMWELDDAINVSPDGQTVAYYETANNGVDNPINSVSSDGKVWKTFVKNGQNFGVLWSPDSQKFVFAKKDPSTQQYQLWYYNVLSGEAKSLGVNTTVDKAVWDKDSQTVYAAVPQTATSTANSLTTDNFFKIDTSTAASQQLSLGNAVVDGQNLFLSLDSKVLYFVNAQDGGFYYFSVGQ